MHYLGNRLGGRPRVNRLRLRASAARTACPPCGESLLELTFQTLGRDVMFGLNLHRDLDPDPGGLEADNLHVVGHVLPVRMVIALAFFKRFLTRSLPMNQAHGPIIEVYGTCCASTNTTFWGAGGQKDPASGTPRVRLQLALGDDRAEVSLDSLERLENRPLC